VGTGFRQRGHAPHAHQVKVRRRRRLFCRVWRVHVRALLCFVLASHRQASCLNSRSSSASPVRPYIHLPHDRRELYPDLYPFAGPEKWAPDARRGLGAWPRGGKDTQLVLIETPVITSLAEFALAVVQVAQKILLEFSPRWATIGTCTYFVCDHGLPRRPN